MAWAAQHAPARQPGSWGCFQQQRRVHQQLLRFRRKKGRRGGVPRRRQERLALYRVPFSHFCRQPLRPADRTTPCPLFPRAACRCPTGSSSPAATWATSTPSTRVSRCACERRRGGSSSSWAAGRVWNPRARRLPTSLPCFGGGPWLRWLAGAVGQSSSCLCPSATHHTDLCPPPPPPAAQGPGPDRPPAAPGVRASAERQPALPCLPGGLAAWLPVAGWVLARWPAGRRWMQRELWVCAIRTRVGRQRVRPGGAVQVITHTWLFQLGCIQRLPPPPHTHRRALTTSTPSRPRPPLPRPSRSATPCPSTARCWRCGKPTVRAPRVCLLVVVAYST